MAPKKTKKTNGHNANLPKGFVLARTRLDGFFERTPGNSVQGILKGSFQVPDKFKRDGTKTVFRIEVTAGETQLADGELAQPGAVIGLDRTGYTSAIDDFENGSAIFVRYDGLEDPEREPSKANPHLFTVGKAE
ncbi:MAG TPA: hypothetical protein DEP35_19490 [Deltaproteobacteria bacterium]|jgi:hypothetical protein|nr:hypothetical protein [Deltaproteobacteria bacterium]